MCILPKQKDAGLVHMNLSAQESQTRRPTNVPLPEPLLREARALKVNVSQACERGLVSEVKRSREQAWPEENRAALDAWDDYLEVNGLTLAKYRLF